MKKTEKRFLSITIAVLFSLNAVIWTEYFVKINREQSEVQPAIAPISPLVWAKKTSGKKFQQAEKMFADNKNQK